jgi:lipid II:glycine glycyltransferase (peptidoglycan interpeptide bridge formation enzyme)
MEIKVRECDDGKEWDALLGKSSNPTVFHRWRCLKIIERHSGCKVHPLVASMGTNAVSVFPLYSKRSKGLRMLFSPPPRTGLLYLGPLFVAYDPVLKAQTIEAVTLSSQDAYEAYVKERLKPNYCRVALTPGYVDARPLIWNRYSVEPQYTYMMDLSGAEDAIFENFQKQVRVDIKKTQREGVVVEEGGKRELEQIHGFLSDRFMQQGLRTNLTLEYLNDLYDELYPANLRVFVAKYQREFVGGFICICHDDRASYWAGGAKTSIKGIYPNDLLQWEAMRWACKQGYKRYEIVDAGDRRLRHFKSKFNPNLSLWLQAERYSPSSLRHIERIVRIVFNVMRLGSVS